MSFRSNNYVCFRIIMHVSESRNGCVVVQPQGARIKPGLDITIRRPDSYVIVGPTSFVCVNSSAVEPTDRCIFQDGGRAIQGESLH